MAIESLVDSKFNASTKLVDKLIAQGAPLLASYWQFREEDCQWTLILVPPSADQKSVLLMKALDLLAQNPYRSVFALSDTRVDSHQIERAKVLGAYIRIDPYIGVRIDMTFTGGQFFESVIPVYFKPELMTHLSVAS